MNKLTPEEGFFLFGYLGSYSFLQNHQQARFLPGRSNPDTKETITSPKDLHTKETHLWGTGGRNDWAKIKKKVW